MRFQSAILAFAASLAFVNAQDLTGVPSCAIPCFVAALPNSGCTITDTACQCTTGRESITNSLLSCAPQRCSTDEVASLAPAVERICANAGVTISNVPTAVPTSGASAATSLLSGTRTSVAASATSSAPASQSSAAAPANIAGIGAVAMGFAAALL